MKRSIIGIAIIASIFLYSCNSSPKKDTQCSENHEHVHEHENHDHQGEKHDEEDHDKNPDEINSQNIHAEIAGLQVETLTPGTFTQVIKTSGRIQTPQGDEVTIVSTINGIVRFSDSSISEGTSVKSGETVVTVSAKNLPEGDPNAKIKIEYESTLKEYNRAKELVKDKIISDKEFEQVKLRYLTVKTAYEAQSSQITGNGEVKITSPVGGYVKNRFVNQGEYVAVGQPIVTISQNKRLQLRAEVSEKYFKDMKSITGANFKPAYENTVYKLSDLNGRLVSFGKTTGQQSFYIPVTFEFDNVGDIISGSFIEVYLLSAARENVLTVPVSAITEEQGLYFVYLQLGEDEYKKQEVTLGHDDGERIMALSGLKSGDRIVTKGVYLVKLASSSTTPEGHTHSH
jgi:RND family efflux transporter MFP subunit